MLPTPRSSEVGVPIPYSEPFVTSSCAVPAVAETVVEITPLKQKLSCKARVTSNLGNGAVDPC